MTKNQDDGYAKLDYMAAWIQHGNILWGTLSGLFVFVGLIANVLTSEKLTLIASIIVSWIASAGIALYVVMSFGLRRNITALEFYLSHEEKEEDLPAAPNDAKLKDLCMPKTERARLEGGFFTGRLKLGPTVNGKNLRQLAYILLFFALAFFGFGVFCLKWGITNNSLLKSPPWIAATSNPESCLCNQTLPSPNTPLASKSLPTTPPPGPLIHLDSTHSRITIEWE